MTSMTINGWEYYINCSRRFYGTPIPKELLNQVLDFAYEMCFGEGHHRDHRTGGQTHRHPGEIFCNTFQGKLAEVVLRKQFLTKGLNCEEPDFSVFGEGKWDDTDLIVNHKTLSVKSAASFSNLLLLESQDYDQNGNYKPNLVNGSTAQYDYYMLVRISPDIKSLFKAAELLKCDTIDKNTIDEIIFKQNWSYDIAGWISHEEFVSVIKAQQIIPRDALLNGRRRMDASNYYIQSGDMHDIDELCDILR